jgi:uncharacterized protein (DUF4415 family)
VPVEKKERFIMNGLPMSLTKQEVIDATKKAPVEGDYIWDGIDEDDRPLNKAEMREGIKNKGGRPKSDNPKKSITIRLTSEVVDYFKSSGQGWQTRIDDVLKNYVAKH